MSEFSAQFGNNFALLLGAFGEGVSFKETPSSGAVNVNAVVQNPIESDAAGRPWDEVAQAALVLIDSADVAEVVAGKSSITMRGDEWKVLRCDLGEGAIWRINVARSETTFAGKGRLR